LCDRFAYGIGMTCEASTEQVDHETSGSVSTLFFGGLARREGGGREGERAR
jgi:hypothetical protein